MLRVTIEGSTVQELHDQIEQMYIHMVSDRENNCECCDQPDCPKNEILHELPDILKTALKDEPEAHDEAKDAPPCPTAEEVRTALNALRVKKGTPAVKAILAAHGANTFPELDASHYAAVMKEAELDG